MCLVELLNQKPRRLLSRGRSFYNHVSLDQLVHAKFPYDFGVLTQLEKDMLEGYLLVVGSKSKVYLATEYQYCSKFLKNRAI